MPQLQKEQIRDRATKQSYSRGESYFKNGSIFDTVRRGNKLEARCHGSSHSPYHVSATLDEDGNIVAATCTCDYDWEGDCKHIVALLLTYLHKPDRFAERASIDDTLAQRSPEELVTLIRQMVERYPDLQALIDRPVPSRQPKDKPVDITPFRRELQQAISSYDEWDEYDDGPDAGEAIRSVAETAHEFAVAGRWRDASAIYRAILEETLVKDSDFVQYDDYLLELNAVLEAVVDCLRQDEIAADDHERRALLNSLLDGYIWDVGMGGVGVGDGTVVEGLLRHVRSEDVPSIRSRILEAQQREKRSQYGQWHVERYESLLVQLDTLANIDPEETLQRLREQGMYSLLLGKLLAIGRNDEAVAVVSQYLTNPYDRLEALPQLVSAGRGTEAIELARATIRDKFDIQLAYWLAGQYKAAGDHKSIFDLWLRGMQVEPSLTQYETLKRAAEPLDKWTTVRPIILQQLKETGRYSILIQIYLLEEEWDAAWETLETIPQKFSGYGVSGLDLLVAEKSRQAYPQKAILVYKKYAVGAINERNRSAYHQAAEYLSIIRELYRQINDENSWRELISTIRDQYPKLRALQDELNQAKL